MEEKAMNAKTAHEDVKKKNLECLLLRVVLHL